MDLDVLCQLITGVVAPAPVHTHGSLRCGLLLRREGPQRALTRGFGRTGPHQWTTVNVTPDALPYLQLSGLGNP